MKKTKGKLSSVPNLAALPPTKEWFELNVKPGLLQSAIWKHALSRDPPYLDETTLRYQKNEREKTLEPVMYSPDVDVIPSEIRKILSCSCQTDTPCTVHTETQIYGCSIFCLCCKTGNYKNPLTVKPNEEDENEEGEKVSED